MLEGVWYLGNKD